MKNVFLLDCTLRDGAYIVDSMFGETAIRGIINKLQETGIEIIECGWLKNKEYKIGSTFYHRPDDLKQYILQKNPNVIYTAMIDWNQYNLDFLPDYDQKSIDAIRIVFPYGKQKEGIEIGKEILKKGYKIFFQAANTISYSDNDLVNLANEINNIKPISLSIVDTFGAMYEEDLDRIVSVLDKILNPEIALGFHSHNNQQLSFALTIHFINLLAKSQRKIIVDASLCGMGRGAGNATTELVASYLNKKHNSHYNIDSIMDSIDIYMGYFKERYNWGYSTPYCIAGLYCCHVNNIAYLLNNHRTSSKDIRNIISSLEPQDRIKYDYDLLEKKYLEIISRHIDDSESQQKLYNFLKNRNILLLAPGKSTITCKTEILNYIKAKNPIIIGVNAMVSDYYYDIVLYVNPARYEYARIKDEKRFYSCKRILLSNIKTKSENDEYIINFEHATKTGWKHFDNAVICCLRLLDWLKIPKVAIAGFDGFKQIYNESYADSHLPSLNPEGKWNELNEEIKSIFSDFKKNAKVCKKIEFLTESYFA